MEMRNNIAADAAACAVTFETADLRRAVDYLARRVVDKRCTIPVLCSILFQPVPGGARLVATDMDITAAFEVPARWQGGDIFALNAQALADLMRKADGDSVTMTARAGRVAIECGRTRGALKALPAAEFPLYATVGDGVPAFTMDAGEAAKDLAATIPFISSDPGRLHINGVYLDTSAGRTCLVATDGKAMSVCDRPGLDGAQCAPSIIIPAKAAKNIAQAIKAQRAATIGWHVSRRLVCVTVGNMALTFKPVDAIFPDWRAVAMGIDGGALQLLMIPEMDARISAPMVARMEKGAPGALLWEAGEHSALVTCADAPHWFAVTLIGTRDDRAGGKFDYNNTIGADSSALRYLEALAQAMGLPDFRDSHLFTSARGYVGAQFGRMIEPAKAETVERPNWQTLAMEKTTVHRPAQFEDGAYCMIMPASHRHSLTVEVEGQETPLRTDTAGRLELSADAVRKLCGPVDPATLVPIASLEFHHGQPVRDGFALPKAPKIDKARALSMTAAEMARYADACRPVECQAEQAGAPAVAMQAPDHDAPAAITGPVECEVMDEPANLAPPHMNAPSAPESAPPVANDPAGLVAMVEALAARVAQLEAGATRQGEVAAATPCHGNDAPPVVTPWRGARQLAAMRGQAMQEREQQDRARRLRIVRAYLCLRAQRAQLRDELAIARQDVAAIHRDAVRLTAIARTAMEKRKRAVLRARERKPASWFNQRHMVAVADLASRCASEQTAAEDLAFRLSQMEVDLAKERARADAAEAVAAPALDRMQARIGQLEYQLAQAHAQGYRPKSRIAECFRATPRPAPAPVVKSNLIILHPNGRVA